MVDPRGVYVAWFGETKTLAIYPQLDCGALGDVHHQHTVRVGLIGAAIVNARSG